MKTSPLDSQSLISTTSPESNDTAAPQLTSVTYSNNASGVLLNSFSKLIFNTPIQAISGDIVMSNGSDIRTIAITDSTQVTINDNVVTVKPKDNLISNSDYTFTIEPGVLADKVGNAFTGTNTENLVSFTTQDLTPPKLLSVSSQGGDVIKDGSMVLIFDKTIQAGNGNIIFSNGTDAHKLSITDSQVSINGNKITINPNTALETGSDYNVQLDAGAVTDALGNNFATDGKGVDFIFENADSSLINTQAPKLTSIVPTLSNLKLIFNTQIKAISGDIVMSNGSDTRTIPIDNNPQITIQKNIITINLKEDLVANSHYTFAIAPGVIADKVGNAFAGNIATFNIVKADTVLTGKAIDGYLSDANVFADANGDGIWNQGESKTTTNASGDFTLTNAKGAIIISGGTDLSTGQAFKGMLKAPEGSTVVTPMTTMQEGFIESGQTVSQAQQSVATAFGFDSSKVDLRTYDPIVELLKTEVIGTVSVDKTLTTQMMASSAQIANFLVTAGQVLQGAAGGTDKLSTQTAGNALVTSLVAAIQNNAKTGNGKIDLADTTLLNSVLIEGAKTSAQNMVGDVTNFEAKIDKIANTVSAILKDSADNITAAVNMNGGVSNLLTNLDKVTAFTQGDVGNSLSATAQTLEPTGSLSDSALKNQIDIFTGSVADTSVTNKIVTPLSGISSTDNAVVKIADAITAKEIMDAAAQTIADAAALKIITDAAAQTIADAAAAKEIADAAAQTIADAAALKIITDAAAAKVITDAAAAKVITDAAAKTIADAAALKIITDTATAKVISDAATAKTIADAATAKAIADAAAQTIADAAALKIITDAAAAKAVADAQAAANAANSSNNYYSPPADTTAPTATLTYSKDGGSTTSTTASVKDADTLHIIATFSEAITDNTPTITINNGILGSTAMTKTDSTHYFYDLNVPAGDIATATVTIGGARDTSNNLIIAVPTNATFAVDNTMAVITLTTGNDSLTGTSGDNIFNGTFGNGAVGTFNGISDHLDGLGGIDTLNLTIGNFATTSVDADWTNVKNFEKVVFNTTGSGAQTITTGTQFDSAFSGNTDLTAQTTNGAITIDMLASSKPATVTATTSVFGAQTITTGSGLTSVTATTFEDAQTITGANLLAVNATATKGAQSITSTGAGNVTVTAIAALGAQTITTGAGNDLVTLTTASGQSTTVTTNAGDDTIIGSLGNDIINGGAGKDIMTGGAGNDTFVFTVDSTGTPSATNFDTITDFTLGDKISATTLIVGTQTGTPSTTVATITAGVATFTTPSDTLANHIIFAEAGLVKTAGATAIWQEGADSYLFISDATPGVDANDVLVKLTGVTAGALTVSSNAITGVTDNIAPTVSSVAFTASAGSDNTFKTGDMITATATFSEGVVVQGGTTPTLELDVGGVPKNATYVSGSGTTALLFSYTVQAGDTDTDGIAIAANKLVGTIKDSAGNSAVLTYSAVTTDNTRMVDTTAPTAIATIMALSADTGTAGDFITNTAAQTISGTYTGTIGVGETLKVSLDNGATWVAATTAAANVWTLTGQTITTNTLKAAVFDTAGNASTAATQAVVLDTTAPTATSLAVASSTTLTATNSEAGTVGVYNTSTGVLIGSTAATTAGGAGIVTVLAQSSVTPVTLKVFDTAGNVATATASVILGTSTNDTLTGTTSADFMFGFGGTNVFKFAATDFTAVNIAGLIAGADTITDWAAGTGIGNEIDFGATTLAAVTHITAAVSGTAQISAAGLATFNGADNTLSLKLAAVVNAVATDAIGTSVVFVDGADSYLFVVGNAATGVQSGDALIKLTNVLATGLTFATGKAAIGTGSTFTLTTNADSFTGTSANDTFNGTYDAGVSTDTFGFGGNDTLDGGAGVDTLHIDHLIDVAITPPDALWTNVSNIEKVVFNTTGNGAQTLTTGSNFNTAFSGGVDLNTATSGAGAINITMTSFTHPSTITASSIAGAQTIQTGSGVSTVTATAGAGALNIAGTGLTTVVATSTGDGAQNIGGFIGTGSVPSGGASLTSVNAVTAGVGAQTIISTSTSAVTVNATSGDGATTVITGSGNDVISLFATSAAGANAITAGAGADTINLYTNFSSADTITQANGDSKAMTANTTTTAIAAGQTITFGNGLDIVNGFAGATDVLDVGTPGSAVSGIGMNSASFTATKTIFLSGAYNAGVFTIALNSAGADTLLLDTTDVADQNITTADTWVLLVGTNSASLISSTFI